MIEKDLPELHILIAEDDEDDAEMIIYSFKKNGLFTTISIVSNGEELIKFLNNNRGNLPDVILTDFNMPFKNGQEALFEMSLDVVLRSIPVFIYSTTINPAYVLQCKALGARDFFVKPFNLNDFDMIPAKILLALQLSQKQF